MNLTFSISPDLHARVEQATHALGLEEAEICRRALTSYLDRYDRTETKRRLNEVYSDPDVRARDLGAERLQAYSLKRNA